MEEAIFGDLERCAQREDFFRFLAHRHVPRGETPAVANPAHLKLHGLGWDSWPNEVAVQRMAGSRFHRVVGGQEGLRDDLPAEETHPVRGTARLCSKRIVVNPIDLQLFNQHWCFNLGQAWLPGRSISSRRRNYNTGCPSVIVAYLQPDFAST